MGLFWKNRKKEEKYQKLKKVSDPAFIARINPQLGIDFSDDKFIKTGDGYVACIYVWLSAECL